MSRLVAALVCLALATAGCAASGAAEPAFTDDERVAAINAKTKEFENVMARCMKGHGFRYTPVNTNVREAPGERARSSGDYPAMKEYRQKYGFGVFARSAYPHDPNVGFDQFVSTPDPYVNSLSKAQQAAYQRRLEECQLTATDQVFGKDSDARSEQLAKQIEAATQREILGDPGVIDRAQQYADCLTGKGYRLKSTKPLEIETQLQNQVDEKYALAAGAGGAGELDPFVQVEQRLPQDQARGELDKEIKIALDDLECGKDYFSYVYPKHMAIEERFTDQFFS
jgi:hypothetical protein